MSLPSANEVVQRCSPKCGYASLNPLRGPWVHRGDCPYGPRLSDDFAGGTWPIWALSSAEQTLTWRETHGEDDPSEPPDDIDLDDYLAVEGHHGDDDD